MKKINCYFLVLVLIFSFTFIACAEAEQGQDRPGQVLTIADEDIGVILDPRSCDSKYGGTPLSPIMEPLVTFNEKMELVPVLAESWDVSEDGKVYTFYLKKGIYFSNGKELTSEDIEAIFDVILRKVKPNKPVRSSAASYGNIERVEVVDRYTIKFILPAPFGAFPTTFANNTPTLLVQPAELSRNPETVEHPIGTGPFKLESYSPGDKLVLTRNENYWGKEQECYWGGKVYLEKVIFRAIPDENSRVMALEAGEVDIIMHLRNISSRQTIEKNNKLDFLTVSLPKIKELNFNVRYWPMNSLEVRQAIAMAVNWDQVAEGIFAGEERASDPFSGTPYAISNISELLPKYNPAAAKKIVEKIEAEKGPIEVSYFFNPPDEQVNKLGTVLKQSLAEVGIDLKFGYYESATKRDVLFDTSENSWDLIVFYWNSGRIDPYFALYNKVYSKGMLPDGSNYFGFKDEKADQLFEEAIKTRDPSQNKDTYQELMRLAFEQVLQVPITWTPSTYGIAKNVHNFVPVPNEIYPFGLHKVWTGKE